VSAIRVPRPAAQLPELQARLGPGARPARAAAAVRDFGLFAALRGHPPARRQGGARRAALVGPRGGLPYRGAGPDEGADGEEHRHRACRKQGRLRLEEGAPRRRPRGLPEGGRRLLPGLPARAARPHRQPGRRQDRAAAAGGARRRRRHLPGGGRRQGTATFSDYANAVSASTATGWATPSRPAAAWVTTTRPWASPRVAPGRA